MDNTSNASVTLNAAGKSAGSRNRTNITSKTARLVQTGVLTAIILIMAFTPIGYIKVGALSISLITIPVAIGAIAISPAAGAFLGLVFGITSFIQCFTGDPFGAALLSINAFFTFLVCIPTRTLAGYLTGIIYRLLKKPLKAAAFYISGLCMAVLNTAFFMSILVLFFWKSDAVQSWAQSLGSTAPFMFILASVSLNAIIEWISTTIIAGSVGLALNRAFRNQ